MGDVAPGRVGHLLPANSAVVIHSNQDVPAAAIQHSADGFHGGGALSGRALELDLGRFSALRNVLNVADGHDAVAFSISVVTGVDPIMRILRGFHAVPTGLRSRSSYVRRAPI